MKKCIMVQTPDQKKLFTYEENVSKIMKFCKLFNAKISLVEIPEETPVLDLNDLATAFCERKTQNVHYTHIKTEVNSKDKKTIIRLSHKIKLYIKSNLMQGKVVSLKELSERYQKYNLTVGCLCNYFSHVRDELINAGYQFIKTGGGKYKIAP